MASVRTPRLSTNVENTVRGTYNDPIVMGALVGSLVVISVTDYKEGNFPPEPKKILAILLVFGILGIVTVSDNRIGRSFSVLILVGLIVKEWGTLSGKGKPVVSKAQSLTATAEETQPGGFGFDFPMPNPVAKNHKKKIVPPQKTGRGTHTQ